MALADVGARGKVGNAVYYKVGKKTFIRAHNPTVKQTKATKVQAKVFGQASSMGSILRRILLKTLPDSKDRNMQVRFVAAIAKWLRFRGKKELRSKILSDFKFSKQGSDLKSRWRINYQIGKPSTEGLTIRFPSFTPIRDLKAPKGTVSVICSIAAGAYDVDKKKLISKTDTEFIFDFDDAAVAATDIKLEFKTDKNYLVLVGIFLQYDTSGDGSQMIRNKYFLPAQIVYAELIN